MYISWYQEHYHEMSNAGLWFRGCGINLLPPELWDKRAYRILIVRLSTARDTIDSFTHNLLYQVASCCEGVFVDCAWLPPPEDAELFDHEKMPWLIGCVSKRPATDFDCIAISNSIVQELINLPLLIKKSNIPLGKVQRLENNTAPLIILGGANALFTGILLNDNPPVDALFVGENVAHIRDIFIKCRDAKCNGIRKTELLRQLTEISGIILPDTPQLTEKKQYDLDYKQLLNNAPVFAGTNNNNTGTIQISEGCPCFCTFCSECWSRKPYRELSIDECRDAAISMKKTMGIDKIDVFSFNFNMHEHFKELLFDLYGLFPSVGLKSQRLDGIADDPDLMKLLHAAGKSSITVGIEGISRRLRIRLQKGLDEAKLHTGLRRILETPLRELKLFFLATGLEEKDDFDEFRELLSFISETMRSVQRQPRIIVSMTPLVRFPFTPLQNEVAIGVAEIAGIIQQCERLTMAKRIEFRTASSMNEYLFSQIALRPVSAHVWDSLCSAVFSSGFVYYREITDSFMEKFIRNLGNYGFSIPELLKGDCYCKLPVTLSVSNSFIDSVTSASSNLKDIGYCSGNEQKEGKCLGCDSCKDQKQVEWNIRQHTRRNFKAEQLKTHIAENNRYVSLSVKCSITETYRGISRNNLASEISRVFMESDVDLVRLYRGFDSSYIYTRCESDWIHGDDIITMNFQENARKKLMLTICNQIFIQQLNQALSGKCTITAISLDTMDTSGFKLRILTPWDCNLPRYCSENAMKYTLVNGTNGEKEYQFSKDALKKKLLGAMCLRTEPEGFSIEITPKEKFQFIQFMKSGLNLPSEKHIYRILVIATIC